MLQEPIAPYIDQSQPFPADNLSDMPIHPALQHPGTAEMQPEFAPIAPQQTFDPPDAMTTSFEPMAAEPALVDAEPAAIQATMESANVYGDAIDAAKQLRDNGVALSAAGRHGRAIDALTQAHALTPLDDLALLHLGLSLTRKGYLKEAITVLRLPFDADPLDPAAATLLGKARLLSGDAKEAIWTMEPAAHTNPGRFNLHFYLGVAYAKTGRYAAARDAWEIAHGLRPKDGDTRRFLRQAQRLLDAEQTR
ncbi:tetratricopeptide repeat protein [Magnetofaba australis]|uniref:MamA-like protein n=1 Tax=Magnetofaba australis IT-1 TaxID=1434232 RepID=W0LMZ2_9PROT|nr:tetratricopeptide repeat protein [Magnetofaba australis]AHG23914.1 MamA-like protein [Magnetofaba australis IT-1]OSM08661.1 putative magnetosome MamA-like protein [Magnetofaba australis IT-1]